MKKKNLIRNEPTKSKGGDYVRSPHLIHSFPTFNLVLILLMVNLFTYFTERSNKLTILLLQLREYFFKGNTLTEKIK